MVMVRLCSEDGVVNAEVRWCHDERETERESLGKEGEGGKRKQED